MYVHPAFHVDRDASLAFAAARGFGLVVACDGGRPVGSALPFVLHREGDAARLEFHVARGNRLAELAGKGGQWLVSVQGSDAYVSPDWYETAGQVPTWLYQMVHLSGPVTLMPDERMAAHLDQLSAKFESWLAPKQPWKTEKVSPQRRQMLMRAIVGMQMSIEKVEGNFKLNQHKNDADYTAVAKALSRQDDAAASEISARMVALRPQLSYD